MPTYTHILTDSFLASLKDTMYAAGEIMLKADRSSQGGEVCGVSDKDTDHGYINFVTVYDKRVQVFLIKCLTEALPMAKFLAEEDDAARTDPSEGLCFVIDPIDGTANFIRDYGCSTVSVGLLFDGEPVLGVVYQPYTDELFMAAKGQGAFLYADHGEGKSIRAAHRTFAEAISVVGTAPYYKDELGQATVHIFKTFLLHTSDVRRSGSAANDLCQIAAGRTDVFAEARLSPWDYAAGAVILSEAGGKVTQLDGAPLRFDRPCSVLAAGRGCYDEARERLKIK